MRTLANGNFSWSEKGNDWKRFFSNCLLSKYLAASKTCNGCQMCSRQSAVSPLSQMQKKTMHFLCQLYTVYCQLYTWTNTFAYLDKYISLLRQIHFTIWTNTKFYYIVSRYAPVKVQFPLSLKCTGFLSMSTVFLDRSAHISIIFPSQIGKSCDDKCVISALNFSGSQVFGAHTHTIYKNLSTKGVHTGHFSL